MEQIPDITDFEKWVIQTSLKKPDGHDVEIQLADADSRLHASDREPTICPVVFRQGDDGCGLVIFNTGAQPPLPVLQQALETDGGGRTRVSRPHRVRRIRAPGRWPTMPPSSEEICLPTHVAESMNISPPAARAASLRDPTRTNRGENHDR
jgi:hypothetical protein